MKLVVKGFAAVALTSLVTSVLALAIASGDQRAPHAQPQAAAVSARQPSMSDVPLGVAHFAAARGATVEMGPAVTTAVATVSRLDVVPAAPEDFSSSPSRGACASASRSLGEEAPQAVSQFRTAARTLRRRSPPSSSSIAAVSWWQGCCLQAQAKCVLRLPTDRTAFRSNSVTRCSQSRWFVARSDRSATAPPMERATRATCRRWLAIRSTTRRADSCPAGCGLPQPAGPHRGFRDLVPRSLSQLAGSHSREWWRRYATSLPRPGALGSVRRRGASRHIHLRMEHVSGRCRRGCRCPAGPSSQARSR
jgi:hypothetical protein